MDFIYRTLEYFYEIGLTPLHFILAYAGMTLFILSKLAELNRTEGFSPKSYFKNNIYTIIASFIMIPVLLILATDSSMKDILPINNVTAVLAGWQTQSTFKTVMSFYKKKSVKATDSDDDVDSTTNAGN